MAGLLATKLEMTRVVKANDFVPVTLLRVPLLRVVAVKTLETDGYNALVIGILKEGKEGKLSEGKKALSFNEFSKIKEILLNEDEISKYNVGDVIDLTALDGVEKVEITGFSKGKGFAGAMKRHNFSGGPGSHGSKFHRALGSIGNRKPTRTHKGKKMHGHMGNEKITIKKVPVEVLNKDLSVVGVRGPVPGARNSLLVIKF
ncbi:MAG: 50S ribosomal protein L3 [Candidatus Gracilibacteria bacterium]|nr:50S ribosomal protein L3 [Candidatus Gracilibacteria bacterium]